MSQNKPKLRQKAILTLLNYSCSSSVIQCKARKNFYNLILLNQKCLNLLFNEDRETGANLRINDDDFMFTFCWQNKNDEHKRLTRHLDAKHIATLIGLSGIEALTIFSNAYTLTKKFVHGWAMISRALKDSKTLKSIKMRMDIPREGCNRFVFENLPDKITGLQTDPEIWSLMENRQCELEYLNLFVQQMNLYYYRLFQIKAKKIELFHDYDGGLWELANSEPLLPNPTIESFKIHFKVDGCLQYFDVSTQTVDNPNFHFVNKYISALECLKMVNPNIKLKLYDWTCYEFILKVEQAIKKMLDVIENTKVFIDVAHSMDIKIKSIKLQDIFRLDPEINPKSKKRKKVNKEFAKYFGMVKRKEEYKRYVGEQIYNGVKIKLSQPVDE